MMHDKLKELLQSPSLPSIRLGWVMGKDEGVSIKEMGNIILQCCVLYSRKYYTKDWIVFGYKGVFGFAITNNRSVLSKCNHDAILVSKIKKCRNPYKIFDYKKSQVLKQIINHFNNE